MALHLVQRKGQFGDGEPQNDGTSRIDEMVAAAKAEINEMAAKAKAKILGNQIGIGFPGVLDARQARQICGALARHAGPRYA